MIYMSVDVAHLYFSKYLNTGSVCVNSDHHLLTCSKYNIKRSGFMWHLLAAVPCMWPSIIKARHMFVKETHNGIPIFHLWQAYFNFANTKQSKAVMKRAKDKFPIGRMSVSARVCWSVPFPFTCLSDTQSSHCFPFLKVVLPPPAPPWCFLMALLSVYRLIYVYVHS